MRFLILLPLTALSVLPSRASDFVFTIGLDLDPGYETVTSSVALSETNRLAVKSIGGHTSQWVGWRADEWKIGWATGLEEGFRTGRGRTDLYAHVQAALGLPFFALGANIGPVFSATSIGKGEKLRAWDYEANVWAGFILLANVRFPSLQGTSSREPVFGLVLSLPIMNYGKIADGIGK